VPFWQGMMSETRMACIDLFCDVSGVFEAVMA